MTIITLTCEQCGKSFNRRKGNEKTARFCSRQCVTDWKKIYVFPFHKAPWLSELNRIPGRNAEISRETAKQRGIKQRGAIRTNGNSYLKADNRHIHRQIMEAAIGRKLVFNEVVHHIDGNKKNNNIENLIILSRAEHSRTHALNRQKFERRCCL